MFAWLKEFLKKALTRRVIVKESGKSRRVRIQEDEPNERFILIIALMIIFFVGLIGLELTHMFLLGTWNEVIFNGIMLVVGTIVGAVWGKIAS